MATQAHFLRLPAELRDRIHELVLISNNDIEIDRASIGYRTAYLGTCKQIRNEASSFFYSENSFLITCDPDNTEAISAAVDWLIAIGPSAHLIRRVGLRLTLAPTALPFIQQLREISARTGVLTREERKGRRYLQHILLEDREEGIEVMSDKIIGALSEIKKLGSLNEIIYLWKPLPPIAGRTGGYDEREFLHILFQSVEQKVARVHGLVWKRWKMTVE